MMSEMVDIAIRALGYDWHRLATLRRRLAVLRSAGLSVAGLHRSIKQASRWRPSRRKLGCHPNSAYAQSSMKKSLGAKTLLYPTPVLVVGSYDKAGKPNAMTAAWGGICCSKPPCVAISLRKATATHGNIVARRAFTISIPSEKHVNQADYLGLASGRSVDKFAVAGLTPVKSDLVDAPYVQEFPLVLECRLAHTIELGLHTQFVGEVLDVKAEEAVLDGGLVAIKKMNPLVFTPDTQSYYGIGEFVGKAFSVGKAL
jgi:flavin reductase (DIM6/NTAB) family NADH-FMN oxidoreductase RutF